MVKTLSRDDIKRSVRDTIREYLGWRPIDGVILTFISYADDIETLCSSLNLNDEVYGTLTATWGKTCTLVMSGVIEASPYICQLRKELEQWESTRVRS